MYRNLHHLETRLLTFSVSQPAPNLERGQTVDGFYHWLAITGTQALDGYGTVMQFNHPGWINFNDWKYHPEVESIAQLEEIGNGWGSSYFFSWDEWVRSLDYGWKVGATNNSDNHTPNWGTITPHRTGVVMPALTKGDLLDALRAGRTYASEDSNTGLFFKANGYWMGSELPNPGNLTFEIWGGALHRRRRGHYLDAADRRCLRLELCARRHARRALLLRDGDAGGWRPHRLLARVDDG